MTVQPARPLVAANWKMNGDRAMVRAYAPALARSLKPAGKAEIVICPPAVLIERMAVAIAAAAWRGEAPALGAQDCHAAASGAFTGDLSAGLLQEAGAEWMILGHSERRAGHAESDALAAAKLAAADGLGLSTILCVGESLAERDSGRAEEVVRAQLSGSLTQAPRSLGAGFAVAYEPVWAIGTGRVASQADVAAMHAAIRAHLVQAFGPIGATVRVLYGGSVKPDNAEALLQTPEVGGLLVGGASLVPESFAAIANAAG
jgi:triosephosphate isomerase